MVNFYFFDTSALVKRYCIEKGTEKIDTIFKSGENIILISNITLVEIVSAFSRKKDMGDINDDEINKVLSFFYYDVLTEFIVLELNNINIALAQKIVLSHHLKAFDAIQLSIALNEIKELNPTFVCSDKILLKIAKKEGFKIFNPEL